MMATATGRRKMMGMEKKACTHIYTAQLHRRKKKKLGIGRLRKKEKKKECASFVFYSIMH
jgi:hypothetical protein